MAVPLIRWLFLICFCEFKYARSSYIGPSEGDIRLVNGNGISGRVEIYHNRKWGTVCDDSFDILDARVICRQLGYIDALEHFSSAHFGAGSGRTWLDNVKCYGNESMLADCSHPGWGIENCGHSEDVGIRCFPSSTTASTYDCNFESGFCKWTQDTNDNFNWVRREGSTPSDDTGPSVDHTYGKATGYYAYIEVTDKSNGNKARLVSPIIRPTGLTYLHFWYHMYGDNINTLNVYIQYLNNSRSVLWTRKGNHGDQWFLASVIVVSQSPFHVVFEGVRGSDFKGDIAIDDILFSEASYGQLRVAAPPYDCDFEFGFCKWTQSKFDNFDWTRHQGPTDTGPSVDHTLGTANGYYAYIETSSRSPNYTALLVSPLIQPTGGGACFRFWYHIYGTDINALNVYIQPLKQSRSALWSRTGGLDGYWNYASVNVVSQSPFKILFEGVRGTGYKGGIAVDDIAFSPLPNIQRKVDESPYDCNFETEYCKWTQGTNDNFDWTKHRGSTASDDTGPSVDHTLGTVNGHYVYIEASNHGHNDTALLVSPTIKPTGGSCLRFWYHMHGSEINALNVYIQYANHSRSVLWTRTGTRGNKWYIASVNVASRSSFSILLEGVRGNGYHGDIAIDDITYSFSDCSASKDISSRGAYIMRLVGGGEPWRGRLEIKYDGQWGTVCNDGFSISEAIAICNQLGYSSREPQVYQSAFFGTGSGLIWLDEVRCPDDSSQTDLRNCASNPWGINDCDHSMDVSINCVQDDSTKNDGVETVSSIRLMDGGEPWKGQLEVLHDGIWGTVSDEGFGVNEAHAVCKELGYDTAHREPIVYRSARYSSGRKSSHNLMWLRNVKCPDKSSNASLRQCTSDPWGTYSCWHSEDVFVDCGQAKPTITKAVYSVNNGGINLLEDGTTIEMKEHDNLLLTVATDANPAATVRLFKDQDQMDRESSILLNVNYDQVQCEQTGTYTFEARNQYNAHNPLRRQFNIDILCKPREYSPKSKREYMYVGKHDDTVTLSEIVMSYPAPNVTWDKIMQTFSIVEYNECTYRISGQVHITGDDDYGVYAATIKNQEGELVIEFTIRSEENIGLIIVSITLGLVCFVCVSVAICMCIRRRARRTKETESRENQYEMTQRVQRSPQGGGQIEGAVGGDECYDLPLSNRKDAKEIEMDDEDYYELVDNAPKNASNTSIYQNVN